MALSTLKADGTQGTATVELLYMYKNGREIRKYDGCIVKNNANLKSFIKPHIKQSADKTKFKESKYFVCMYDPDFKEERNGATVCVSCHRFSKPSQPKKCELNFSLHNFVKVQDHIFFPCDSQHFNDSNFLEKHSKKILVARGLREEIYGLTNDGEKDCLKFVPLKLLKLDHPPSSNVYGISAEDHKKLEDAGLVLLQDNKTVVGSLKKRGNNEISISIFGNNQEITTTSCTDGAPGDGTEQAAATPGDEIGQAAATLGDRTGQAAYILESAPGDEDEELHRERERLEEERLKRERLKEERLKRERLKEALDTWFYPKVKYLLRDFIVERPQDFNRVCSMIDGECSFHGSKDLADRLDAPPLIKAKCESNTAHSPTLKLMQSPKVSTLSVNVLARNLKAISRYDVADPIEKEIPEEYERNCQLNFALNRYERLFKEVATMLDKEARNNWRTLGSKFGLQRDELEQIVSNPARILLEDYVYPMMDAEDLTYGWFQQLVNVVDKPSSFLRASEDDCRSMKDVFPPSSEKMWRLCLNLNKSKEVGGMKKWEHLAACWGIKPEIYSQFDPSQKTSPTEILLRWLVGERPDFTVNELCYHLGKIGCHDAKVFLEGKLKECIL